MARVTQRALFISLGGLAVLGSADAFQTLSLRGTRLAAASFPAAVSRWRFPHLPNPAAILNAAPIAFSYSSARGEAGPKVEAEVILACSRSI